MLSSDARELLAAMDRGELTPTEFAERIQTMGDEDLRGLAQELRTRFEKLTHTSGQPREGAA